MKRIATILVIVACATMLAACNEDGPLDTEAAATPAPSEPAPETPAENPAPPVKEELYHGGLTKDQRISDAQMIVGLLDRGYAPRQWKEDLLGINFDEQSQALIARAGEDITDAEFYDAVAKYLAGFHDSHISWSFPSTLVASLPFEVDDIEGRLVVVAVDEAIEEGGIPLAVGDELVSIDGQEAKSVRDSLIAFGGEGNPRTEVRYATRRLTLRQQEIIPVVPSGMSTIIVRRAEDATLRTLVFPWKQTGYTYTAINEPGLAAGRKALSISAVPLVEQEAGHHTPEASSVLRDRITPRAERLKIGAVRPFFSLGDGFVERKEGPLYSGVLQAGGRRLGVLRIHTYSNRRLDFEQALAELEEELAYFEANTDALVIDQTGNGGGSFCFALQIASMFFDKPFAETLDVWRANRDNLLMMEAWALETDAQSADHALAERIVGSIQESMTRGDILTEPLPSCSLDGTIIPYAQSEKGDDVALYTKPVLILVDELAVSCGDYFPALMQDNGRAVIFGVRTSGGGGAIKGIESRIGYSEIKVSFTVTMGVRPTEQTTADGHATHYIENTGVAPDIDYPITYEDFQSGYQLYRDAVVTSALSLVGQSPPSQEDK